MKELKHYQDLEARKHGYMTIEEAEKDFAGKFGSITLLTTMKYDAQEAWAADHYPIQDDTWVNRRWNKEQTEYVDLSGY